MGVMSSSVHSPWTTVRRACRFPGQLCHFHMHKTSLICNNIRGLLDLEHVGIAVEITLISYLQAYLKVLLVWWTPSWISQCPLMLNYTIGSVKSICIKQIKLHSDRFGGSGENLYLIWGKEIPLIAMNVCKNICAT